MEDSFRKFIELLTINFESEDSSLDLYSYYSDLEKYHSLIVSSSSLNVNNEIHKNYITNYIKIITNLSLFKKYDHSKFNLFLRNKMFSDYSPDNLISDFIASKLKISYKKFPYDFIHIDSTTEQVYVSTDIFNDKINYYFLRLLLANHFGNKLVNELSKLVPDTENNQQNLKNGSNSVSGDTSTLDKNKSCFDTTVFDDILNKTHSSIFSNILNNSGIQDILKDKNNKFEKCALAYILLNSTNPKFLLKRYSFDEWRSIFSKYLGENIGTYKYNKLKSHINDLEVKHSVLKDLNCKKK